MQAANPDSEADRDAVQAYISGVSSPTRRRDAATMVSLIERATGEAPRMWNASIVGAGRYHYQYASGRQGDAPAASYSARKTTTTVYLPDGVGAHVDSLDQLGPHTTGVGCVYIKDLTTVDLDVLERIVRDSYRTLTAGVYRHRARESGGTS